MVLKPVDDLLQVWPVHDVVSEHADRHPCSNEHLSFWAFYLERFVDYDWRLVGWIVECWDRQCWDLR
jgi:hypothetical protein